jgi:hypothetical protein
MNDIPLCVTTKHAAKMAAKEVSKQPVAEQADAKQKTNNKLAEVVKKDFFRALVLIGVAAAFCAAFVSHMTKPSVASELAEIDHACPPQWLPVILASTALLSSSSQNSEFIRAYDNSKPAKLSSSSRHDDDPSPNCGSADEIWPCWVKCHQQGGSTAEIRACKAANCPILPAALPAAAVALATTATITIAAAALAAADAAALPAAAVALAAAVAAVAAAAPPPTAPAPTATAPNLTTTTIALAAATLAIAAVSVATATVAQPAAALAVATAALALATAALALATAAPTLAAAALALAAAALALAAAAVTLAAAAQASLRDAD